MTDRIEVDFSALEEYRRLSPDRRGALKVRVVNRAGAERAECQKAALRWLGLGLQRLGGLPGHLWHKHLDRRHWQAEIKDLYGLDDRALRDIGMTRLDVHVLARMRDPFKK